MNKAQTWFVRSGGLHLPASIYFGPGCAEMTGKSVLEVGCKTAFVLADPNVIAGGLAEPVLASLREEGVEYDLCDNVEQEPSKESLDTPLAKLKRTKADIVIAIGGGSTIDTAKAIALLGKLGGSIGEFLGVNKVARPGFPVVALPTTSGTGSEVSPGGVLVDKARKMKTNFISYFLVPRIAIVDPLLTTSAPKNVVASAGVDALSHAVESFISTKSSPITELFSLEAIRLIGRSLREAVWDRSNLTAITMMAQASLYAGIGMANASTAAAHALAYPIGARYSISHGVSVGMVLPGVMKFNAVSRASKFAEIAKALLGMDPGIPERQAAIMACDACSDLISDVGIPSRLPELAAEPDEAGLMASEAIANTRLMDNNPRPMTSGDAEAIYRSLF